jgi:hypothetical protein
MNETAIQRQTNGSYLIDSNHDGSWEYRYNVTTGMLSAYQVNKGVPGFGLVLVFCAVAVLLFLSRKRRR